MRHLTLVEQMATYSGGVFTLTDAVAGRLTWGTASGGEGGDHFYRAANADESEWEIAIGTYDGGTGLTRTTLSLSSTGSAIDFTGSVKVSLIAPAGAMLSVDSNSAYRSAIASGSNAMAAGIQSGAYGQNALALGFNTTVGFDGGPVADAIAIGSYAQSLHREAIAIGKYAGSLIEEAIHHRGAFWWSSRNGSTSGAEVSFLRNVGPGSEPSILEGSQIALKGLVVATNYDNDRFYAAELTAMVRRNSGGVAAVLGTPTVTEIYKTPGAAVSATIAGTGTGGAFGIQITGESGQDWNWGGELRGVWV